MQAHACSKSPFCEYQACFEQLQPCSGCRQCVCCWDVTPQQKLLPLVAQLVCRVCSAAFSTWQARKLAQRAALEAQARAKEEAFYTAMKVSSRVP